MSIPKIFVTGVTGYVGGDALFAILNSHPDWQYTFLVRDRKRVESFASQYPKVRILVGNVTDAELLRREAVAADIILTYASSDDTASAQAVASAIASDSKRRFWIHTSGAANLMHEDLNRGVLGEPGQRIWDDVDDVEAINQWPQEVLHRPVEKIALEAGDGHPNVKTAVVCPPAIVGVGRGPGNKRTIQVPILIELIRQHRRAFQVGRGKAMWSFIHIHDLSDLYLRLIEAAAAGGGSADWGRQGWYFAENGDWEWGAITKQIARRLHEAGVLESEKVDSLDNAEARKIFGRFGPGLAGANSRSRATRARTRLHWKPAFSDFEAAFDEQVREELAATQSRLADFKQGNMPVPPPPRAKI